MPEQYTFSYWEKTSLLARPDVCIIGAGLTGLQTALALKKLRPKMDVMLMERGAFSRGASTRNAGFACFGSPTELLEDLENSNEETVIKTVERRYRGIQKLEREHGAAVNYIRHGGYEIIDDAATYADIITRLPHLNQLLESVTGNKTTWRPVNEASGIRKGTKLFYNSLEGQLHPGLLVQRLEAQCRAAGIRILFGAEVATVEETARSTEIRFSQSGKIEADKVLFTTNAFTPRLLEEMPIEPARNQVFITEKIPGLSLRGCFHKERGYVYFRNVGPDRLLIGGARHLDPVGERTDQFGFNEDLLRQLFSDLHRCSPEVGEQTKIEQRWSGIIAQGPEKSPIIEKISERRFVAARLAGMGVALSGRVAEEAAALLAQ